MKSNRFCTIQNKLNRFRNNLIGILVCCFLLESCVCQYIVKQQNYIMEQYRIFSEYIGALEQTDQDLYLFVQVASEELQENCKKDFEILTDTIQDLAQVIQTSQLTDLEKLTKSYYLAAEYTLTTHVDLISHGVLYSSYENTQAIKNIIIDLLDNYYDVINQYVVTSRKQLNYLNLCINATIFMIACVAVIYLSLYFERFSKGIVRAIQRLTDRAEKNVFGKELLEVEAWIEPKDELDILNNAFNEMLKRNYEYIEKLKNQAVLEQKLAQEQIETANLQAQLTNTQLKMLQARMNPHFVFNILNVISGLAMDEEAERTTEAIIRTAEYFRYSLVNLDKIVRLEEEIRNVRDYLEIQKLRFDERIMIDISMEEECGSALICAMILQPLCENALIHGIIPQINGGKIKIYIRKQQNMIEIQISDNGCGMSTERLHEIRQRICAYQEYDDNQGIGIVNIYHRLVLCIGKDVQIEIYSEKDRGTDLILRIPFYTKIEEVKNV